MTRPITSRGIALAYAGTITGRFSLQLTFGPLEQYEFVRSEYIVGVVMNGLSFITEHLMDTCDKEVVRVSRAYCL